MGAPARFLTATLVATIGVWSCDDATDVELLQVGGTGAVFGQAFLDLDGSGALDAGDTVLVGASVVLSSPSQQDTAREAATDANGLYLMLDVPVGIYELSLNSTILGDSLTALAGTGHLPSSPHRRRTAA